MAHGGLTAVGLPVGIRDETDRGIKGEIGRNGGKTLRIERQQMLEPHQSVEQQEAKTVDGQHRERVAEPRLLPFRIDARGRVDSAFDRHKNGRENGLLPAEHSRHVKTERPRCRDDRAEHQRDLKPTCDGHVRPSRAGSELFRIDERVDQVRSQGDGDAERDERIRHDRLTTGYRAGHTPPSRRSLQAPRRERAHQASSTPVVRQGEHEADHISFRCGIQGQRIKTA